MINADLAAFFVHCLTGDTNTIIDWRCIHDTRKDLPAHNYRGTLGEILPTLTAYNNDGYGIFCNINAMDGGGRDLQNVAYIRAHVVDLDNTLTAQANYERAAAAGASFAVQSSAGKFHIYWKMQPYTGNDFYSLMQRKLNQLYDGDRSIIDATRVMRVPGFIHRKGEPQMVNGWQLPAIAHIRTADELNAELAHINIVEHFSTRSKLGEPTMAAPSLDWLVFALSLLDPNDLERPEWVSLSAAVKQAGWVHTDEQTLLRVWLEWCARYRDDDVGVNMKLWHSIRDTEVGWTHIEKRSPVKAYMTFGFKEAPAPLTPPAAPPAQAAQTQQPAALTIPPQDTSAHLDGEILSEYECKEWFKDCYFVNREGKIFSPAGRMMNSTQFNGRYGGRQFIITSTGKLTDEPWKAALRSTCYTIPKVDHIRFLPDRPSFEVVTDQLGRLGLNTYVPARVVMQQGDVSPWLDHVARIIPDANDQRIFFEYLAHCVKFPGHKVPWAYLLQSAEGIGKTVFFEVMQYTLGDMYVYTPKAQELVKSGSTFNAWMRNKLMIVVNELKIDERRELIEILKPMITDARVEVQSKGVDQEMEDNVANWLMFSNYKDAVPININGRRYVIQFSALQSAADLERAGMNDDYFNRLWRWLRVDGGYAAVAYWLKNYPIERGGLPVRAPKTSSYAEALSIGRSPMEVVIADCITDGLSGFRGGYISTLAVMAKVKAAGIRTPAMRNVQSVIEAMGYVAIGRAPRPFMQEDISARSELYGQRFDLPVEAYGRAQGYE